MRLGPGIGALSVDGVCVTLIGADHDELVADLAARFPQATLVANEAFVHGDLAKVIRFVDNPAAGLHLTLDMRGTPLHRRVWEKLRAISVGRTVTYMELGHGIKPRSSTISSAPAVTSVEAEPKDHGECSRIGRRASKAEARPLRPKADKPADVSLSPLCATSRHMQCNKRSALLLYYSITSSVRASSIGGMSRLSERAVCKLSTNSNLVDCRTGRSAGLTPLRI